MRKIREAGIQRGTDQHFGSVRYEKKAVRAGKSFAPLLLCFFLSPKLREGGNDLQLPGQDAGEEYVMIMNLIDAEGIPDDLLIT